MAIDVIMPKMGESITEGTILEWKKNIGDTIALDETLLEISTDKVDSEIPSPAAGVLTELLFSVNDVVEVGTVIARIGGEGEAPVDQPKVADSQGINVRAGVGPMTEKQFGSHVVWGAAETGVGLIVNQLGQAEVANLRLTALGQHHVIGLQISVYDAVAVCSGEARGDVQGQPGGI